MKGHYYNRKRIEDEFTKLPVSRQRKWQLRHPEKAREINERYWEKLKTRSKPEKAKKEVKYHEIQG